MFPPFHVTETVPLRAEVDAFGATTSVNVPLSLAEAAPLNVTQLAFDVALQVQLPETLVTARSIVAPAADGDCEVDDTVYAHVVGDVADSFLLQAAATTIAMQHTQPQRRIIGDIFDSSARNVRSGYESVGNAVKLGCLCATP